MSCCSSCARRARVAGVTVSAPARQTVGEVSSRVEALASSLAAAGVVDAEWADWLARWRAQPPLGRMELAREAETLARHAERLGGALSGRVRVSGAGGLIAESDVPDWARQAEGALGAVLGAVTPMLGVYGEAIDAAHGARMGAMYGDAEWARAATKRSPAPAPAKRASPVRTAPRVVVVQPKAPAPRKGRAAKGASASASSKLPGKRR